MQGLSFPTWILYDSQSSGKGSTVPGERKTESKDSVEHIELPLAEVMAIRLEVSGRQGDRRSEENLAGVWVISFQQF